MELGPKGLHELVFHRDVFVLFFLSKSEMVTK